MNYKMIQLDTKLDKRGKLIALESNKNLPFAIKRVYYIYDTLPDAERGFHAHKQLEQLVVAMDGACEFVLDDGKKRDPCGLIAPMWAYILVKICGEKCGISHMVVS
ncbi:WxcM domain-containing protein [Helicobacter cinaedi]|uniref:WxcM domain-containing protein n=1 Tax=Helicobacter cinaedi TaxID=213 RepID=A0A377JPL6_9HELI|nr:WxcM domain-containing protein [Helicobacter cinaedi]